MKNNFLKRILLEIKDISIPLYKILIPFVFIIKLLEESGIINWLANMLQPVMISIGLTPELGLVFVTAFLINIYAALVLFINLLPQIDVSVAQITILATMILIAHNIPIESTISGAAGINFIYTSILRLISAIAIGIILNFIYKNFGLLQEKFTTFFKLQEAPTDLKFWFFDQIKTLIYIFVIVSIMVTVLNILRLVGIEKLFEKVFVPPLRLFGIKKEAMNVIIVGLTIGLQFGGGILIKEIRSGKIDKQSAFLSVSMLNLLHALIEDTILMIMVGGHWSGVFFGRIIFSLTLCFLIFKIFKKYFSFFESFIFNKSMKNLKAN